MGNIFSIAEDAVLFSPGSKGELNRRDQPRESHLIFRFDAPFFRLHGNAAIHRSSVDVEITQSLCQFFSDRALAGAGRPINGDDQSLILQTSHLESKSYGRIGTMGRYEQFRKTVF